MLELLSLVFGLLRVGLRSRADLVAENVLLRQQLAVLTRPSRKRPRLRTRDKVLWLLIRAVWRDWRRHLLLVRPATVVGWRRQGWRLFWGGRSHGRPGRPRLAAETRALIARMARENPAWGSERIRGELLKLGIVVSKRSVQRYRGRGPARPPSQTWRTFLTNHVGQLRAAEPSPGADAHVSAVLGGAVQPRPGASGPAAARDRDPGRLGSAAIDHSDATGTGVAHPERPPCPDVRQRVGSLDGVGGPRAAAAAGVGTRCDCQPPASARAPVAGVRGSPDHRPRAAAARPARRACRVLRPRAPPPYAPPGASQAACRVTPGPLQAQLVVGALRHSYGRAA
ncbi:MAG: helix-turn-helix domain-containing protein [Chloroflexota bacterium]|nr:helix-turn-helix domain-containing protein [Chloroflexota bacterium]